MKNRIIIRFIALIAITVIFSYCKKPTEFKEIEVDNLFTLQVPVYLHPTNDLLPFNAPNIHQYEDSVGKICLLVFDTSKAGIGVSSLKTFYDSMVVSPVMDSARILPPQLVKVDNDSTYQTEITGIMNNVRVFSEIETIATKERYYFIQTWSSLDRRDKLKPDMLKMLNSFHDISHPQK